MFHEGNLQSGITRAIREQKLVGCFVRDDGAESTTWEDEWLKSGWLSSLLEQKAVLLRLEAGSTEAGFLSAFCTISATPTFIVIQNGQLQEHLSSGISQNEFVNRVRKVLGAPPIPGTAQPTTSVPQTSTPEPARIPPPARPTDTPEASTSAPAPPLSSNAKGKQKATSPAPQPELSVSKAQQDARDALRKKKQEEKEELARIKARIEADKAERKAQAEARKAERERLAQAEPTTSQRSVTTSSKGSNAKEVHLNVRMFDGATIRATFPRIANLQDDVRPWIDREFVARAENPNERHPPYYFKQILAPLPSRELSAGEESQTLSDIDLAPSATLVLQPVKGYTEAYSGNSRGIVGGAAGGVFSLVGGAFNLAGSTVGYVSNTLSSVLGGGASAQQDTLQQPTEGRSLGNTSQEPASSAGIRVRTLADQRSREPRNEQLYNGNQLNFEPRDDDSNR
ncbi:hypothetical protein BU23DRAFT_503558 [Bimuria novae-zelandiae CBS 107.79]|uniref:UBX domain-containing protein n=1 Tax=Bimuria novae-zelandiae CBS 107.79 TaxID=1447943 RepID=A0A6A5VEN2_9PLEO|nr:hypothetical protein BU23DRAFT_503558 [Bimuria novae-zelandiae CBS 107.79]